MDTEHLENPDYERLDDSYRSMERLQELSLSISGNELATTLNNLEKIGYVALRIKAFASSDAAIEILASKGKHGPCYDTERKITYTGSALAVMDDDLHLLIKNKDNLACEKTASIYQFAAYNNYLDVSPANKDLLEKLKTSPVNFDCNDYEDNLQALLKSISDKSSADETVQVFYQGPFKYLILADGAMLRRGEDNTVSKSQASELISGDACFMSTDQSKGKIRFLSELYKEQGSACLLEQANVREQVAQSTALNLDALETVHADLRSRLLSCIETRAEYFILIGSDPRNELGCCPSEEVGSANRLLEAGILQRYIYPAAAESCPTSLYCFRDELTDKGGALKFQTNTKFRSDMQTRLLKDSEPNILKNAVRWILLIFLLLALIQAFTKFNHVPAADSRPLYESLALTKPDQLVILLFHYEKRCEQCLNMEAFSKAYIKQHPEVELRLVNIAKTKQQSLVSHFNIVTSSIVIMRFRDKKPLHSSFVKELLDSYKDKERFIKELSLAIDSLGLDK